MKGCLQQLPFPKCQRLYWQPTLKPSEREGGWVGKKCWKFEPTNHHISKQEQVQTSTDETDEPATMTEAPFYWHSNLLVPIVQPLPEVKVVVNWSPNFTRQIRKPHPTITDSIADLMQVLLWNSTDTEADDAITEIFLRFSNMSGRFYMISFP